MDQYTFQHLATASFSKQNESCLRLYGRTVDKKSICVVINDIKPYGFIKTSMKWWSQNGKNLQNSVKLLSINNRFDYFKNNKRDTALYIYEKMSNIISCSETKGYCIRNVHENNPDIFLKITAKNTRILNDIVKIIKKPCETHQTILNFMDKWKRCTSSKYFNKTAHDTTFAIEELNKKSKIPEYVPLFDFGRN